MRDALTPSGARRVSWSRARMSVVEPRDGSDARAEGSTAGDMRTILTDGGLTAGDPRRASGRRRGRRRGCRDRYRWVASERPADHQPDGHEDEQGLADDRAPGRSENTQRTDQHD